MPGAGDSHSISRLPDVSPSACGMQGENALRLLTRLLMLPVPGFSDHLPSDYELALRRELRLLQG